MDVSAKSMAVSAKEYRCFGQIRWTFRPEKADVSARKNGHFGQIYISVSVHILANNALRAHHASVHGGVSANGLSDMFKFF